MFVKQIMKKMNLQKKTCQCGKKLYGYGDGVHEVWLCYVCGKFIGTAGGDTMFGLMAKAAPELIMRMIHEKILTPIEHKKHGIDRRNKTFGR